MLSGEGGVFVDERRAMEQLDTVGRFIRGWHVRVKQVGEAGRDDERYTEVIVLVSRNKLIQFTSKPKQQSIWPWHPKQRMPSRRRPSPSRLPRHQHISTGSSKEGQNKRTFAHIPAQMSETVPRVEGEREGEDGFSRVLDGVGHSTNELDDMCAVECSRCDEVGEGESVEDYHRDGMSLRCVKRNDNKKYARTLSAPPVTRFAMDPIHVSCGW